MTRFSAPFLTAASFLILCCAVPPAQAADAPPDPCSLLPATLVSSTLGGSYGTPEKSTAPRPYSNTVQGTDCTYSSKSGGGQLLFRIYFDHSVDEATGLHAKLKMFYSPPTPVSVGDEAYFDPHSSIHVRKGNVRYYLSLGDAGAAAQKQITALATQVAGQL